MAESRIYRASVDIVVRGKFRNDLFLVVTNRKRGKFSMPGGKVDMGEALEDAARRELLEETGLRAFSLRVIGAYTHDAHDGGPDWFCMAYEAEIGDQEPKEVEAGTKPYWTDAFDIRQNSLYPNYYAWLFPVLGVRSIDLDSAKAETEEAIRPFVLRRAIAEAAIAESTLKLTAITRVLAEAKK